MPESNLNQTSLRDLVRDAESQVENLTRSLEALKTTVRRLAAQIAISESDPAATGTGYGFGKPAEAAAAESTGAKPFDFSATAAALSRELEDAPVASQPPAAAVPTEPHHESEWYGVSDGGSWPVGPNAAAHLPKGPAPHHPTSEPAGAGNEDITSDVTEAVAALEEPVAAATGPEDTTQTPAEPDEWTWTLDPEPSAAEAPSPQEAFTQDDADGPKISLSSGWPDESIWSQSFEWPAMRGGQGNGGPEAGGEESKDDFRSIVDQVRAEVEAARARGEPIDLDLPGEEDADGDDDRRAEVQRLVEEMRHQAASLDADSEDSETPDTSSEGEGEDDEARREEARRAVEQMRAELSGGAPASFPPAVSPKPSIDWAHMQAEVSGPPVIVVKDTEGRVELANVYDLLNRIECGESAALLNYTPHSVTVGLPIRSAMPSLEAIESAVSTVFGREGLVDTDGVRITVQMGEGIKRRRSEDAA